MRTIKFRGKTYDGVWVVGDLLQPKFFLKNKEKQHTKTWIVVSAFSNGGWLNIRQRYAVIPETVGQFTGLTDKNGKEIWEGDFCKDTDGRILEVGWSDKFSSFVLMNKKWAFKHWFGESCDPEEVEVIGNIHDNPELL